MDNKTKNDLVFGLVIIVFVSIVSSLFYWLGFTGLTGVFNQLIEYNPEELAGSILKLFFAYWVFNLSFAYIIWLFRKEF